MLGEGSRAVRPATKEPKLNGAVERANRTHTEEFYQMSTSEVTVAAMSVDLAE